VNTAARLAAISIASSAFLAALNIFLGWRGGSTSVTAAGIEFAGDVLTSSIVLFGTMLATKPADENHPYGHGRIETLAGLLVGMILLLTGVLIGLRSLRNVTLIQRAPEEYTMWPLAVAVLVKSVLSATKFHFGRRVRSAALVADAWNDAVDILSGMAAMGALALALSDPTRFLAADHYGGFAVGLIVIYTGLRVTRDASLELIDTMPDPALIDQIRTAAREVEGVWDIEKIRGRKTGFQYHIDLHLEVDPTLSVQQAHVVAGRVRHRVRELLPAVADVLVHIEPGRSS